MLIKGKMRHGYVTASYLWCKLERYVSGTAYDEVYQAKYVKSARYKSLARILYENIKCALRNRLEKPVRDSHIMNVRGGLEKYRGGIP